MQFFGNAVAGKTLRFSLGGIGAALVTAALSAPAAHAQVIFNEDFTSSLATGTATSTDYTQVPLGTSTLPQNYRVISNPATDFTNGYASYFDHTQGTAQGAMLFFDGAASTSTRIFYRSATLTAGTQYTFSFWGSSGSTQNVPVLGASVDGFSLGASSLTTQSAVWQQFTATYTPTVGGLHTFAVYDINTIGSGNDGAIDDVRLVGPAVAAPEPGSLTLLAPFAVGAAGMVRLRRRRRNACPAQG